MVDAAGVCERGTLSGRNGAAAPSHASGRKRGIMRNPRRIRHIGITIGAFVAGAALATVTVLAATTGDSDDDAGAPEVTTPRPTEAPATTTDAAVDREAPGTTVDTADAAPVTSVEDEVAPSPELASDTPADRGTTDTAVADPARSSPDAGGEPQFFEDFAAESGFRDRFDISVSHGVDPLDVPDAVLEWSGDHDMSCAGPTSQRIVHVAVHAESFWWCAPKGPESGHLMTSLNTLGYGIASFSPRQVFEDVSRVCWTQNLTDLGGRKWTQMLVLPEDTFQANGLRLDYVSPGFGDAGSPGENQLIPPNEAFGLKVLVGTVIAFMGREELGGSGPDLFTTEDKAKRYRHCVTDLGDGTVEIEQERDDGTYTWTSPGEFPDGPVRVIFEDDNYDGPKSPPEKPVEHPFTWHWDDIEVT